MTCVLSASHKSGRPRVLLLTEQCQEAKPKMTGMGVST